MIDRGQRTFGIFLETSMKKILLACAVFVTVSTQAFAFIPQMSFFVNREVATARVWNTTYRPIVCSGYAFGQTWSGVVLNAYVNNAIIYPNRSVDVYVHSNYYDPMVQAWAQIDCQIW